MTQINISSCFSQPNIHLSVIMKKQKKPRHTKQPVPCRPSSIVLCRDPSMCHLDRSNT